MDPEEKALEHLQFHAERRKEELERERWRGMVDTELSGINGKLDTIIVRLDAGVDKFENIENFKTRVETWRNIFVLLLSSLLGKELFTTLKKYLF